MNRVRDASSPLAYSTGLVIDVDRRSVSLDGVEITLTHLECLLLRELIEHPGVVLSPRHLVETVWGQVWLGDDHVVETHIGRLRGKLGETARQPRFIHTLRGVGYRFEPHPPQRRRHLLIYDADLVLIGLEPEGECVLGWHRRDILDRFFLLTAEATIRNDQQAALRCAQTLSQIGRCLGPNATAVLDAAGRRHVVSTLLCFDYTASGDFGGMRAHMILDHGRAAETDSWPADS